MTTKQCTPSDDGIRYVTCNVRLIETVYGIADDGFSNEMYANVTPSEQDEIDMLLALAEEGERCRFCRNLATHLIARIPVCSPPCMPAPTSYASAHGAIATVIKLKATA